MPESTQKKSRIQWSDREWETVARELYRVRPVEQYLRSTSLAGLQRADFFQAQMVLPENRRRPSKSIVSLSTVKPGLLKGMTVVRAEIDAELARKKLEDAKTAFEMQEAAKAALPPPPNPYELAFAPLVNLIATEVTKRMQVLLAEAFPQVSKVSVESPLDNVAGVPRKPKFGVVGPLGVQAQEIRKAYPNVEFVTIESGQAASSPAQVAGCDKIIGMTDFMNHSIDGVLKDRFGDKYVRTTGSTSSVKRLIGVLLAAAQNQQDSRVH